MIVFLHCHAHAYHVDEGGGFWHPTEEGRCGCAEGGRGSKRRGLPTKRGGRRRSSAAEDNSQEPLPIIEHELAAQPLPYEVRLRCLSLPRHLSDT